jgi:hypothetical protein
MHKRGRKTLASLYTRGRASENLHPIGYLDWRESRIFASSVFLARGVGQLENTSKDRDVRQTATKKVMDGRAVATRPESLVASSA